MTAQRPPDEPITFKGTDIRELSRDDLIEALRAGFAELVVLRDRLSDESRMEAGREEDFTREMRARSDFFGTLAEFQSRIFDTSTAYNQLIAIGGYAAFFAVWSAVAKEIDRIVLLISGGLIVVSLLVYVTWTVVNMYRVQSANMATLGTFAKGPEGFEERYKAAVADGHGKNAKLAKFWLPVVWLAGMSGFGAAALLGGAAFLSALQAHRPTKVPVDNVAAIAERAAAAEGKARCYARVAELYGLFDSKTGHVAVNKKTGQHALLIDGRWEIVPTCPPH
jgi:heme exporter protein D